MAQLTVATYVADATALGANWQRYITLTDTTKAVEIKLDGAVGVVYLQSSTNDLLVNVEGTAGVALDGAAFVYDADQVAEVKAVPTRAAPGAPYGRIYVQPGTNPTTLRVRAQRTTADG
jgi:hypothetical protein